MTEEKYTRCPSCKTVFRVTDAQLALRDGVVRCGHCQTIFDGHAELISLAPRVVDDEAPLDEAAMGPPTVTLRSARALRPAEPEAPAAEARTTGAGFADADDTQPPGDSVDYEHRFAWDQPAARRRLPTWVYGVLVPLLCVLLAGQLLYHFRDVIAAHWPATRAPLARMCAVVGCDVKPLRDVGALSIDASDLQVDPAHKGLLILTATVRNRAPYAIAYPYLELTLTDPQDQVVVRRAFAPGEYVGGTVDVAAGMPGNGEAALKLFIDASATAQAGYRLYLFYP
ncbi:MAG: DUF3426 domain-containing protein [Proteobacteria bacterium]|nr:DUF3426 domain-containing protein [Pseudomonadota bacterium]